MTLRELLAVAMPLIPNLELELIDPDGDKIDESHVMLLDSIVDSYIFADDFDRGRDWEWGMKPGYFVWWANEVFNGGVPGELSIQLADVKRGVPSLFMFVEGSDKDLLARATRR